MQVPGVSAVVAFESACQDILGVNAADVSVEKLQGWKEEIRVVAEAQLRDSRRVTGSLAVQYFLLKREIESADSISPFADSVAFQDSSLCSETLQNLSSVSQELLRGREAKVKKLKELEKQLFLNQHGQDIGEDELKSLEARSRALLAQDTMLALQEEMEGLLHSLEKLRLRVTSEADSSKIRSALRKKEATVKKHLGKLVERYNIVQSKVQVERGPERQSVVLDALLTSTELPWQFDRCLDAELEISPGVHRTLQFIRKYELVEAFNKLTRLREEKELLLREQRIYLSFYTACQHNLEARIKSWNEQLFDLLEGGSHESNDSSFEMTGRYSLVDFDIAGEANLIRGTISRLWKAHEEAREQLRKGQSHFERDGGGLGLPWPKHSGGRPGVSLDDRQSDPFVELDVEDD
jgi:hypothetical protein